MDNKLIKINEGFFNKIITKIRQFFFKQSNGMGNIPQVSHENNIVNERSDIRESIRVDITGPNSYQKEEIIKQINNNPDVLEEYPLSKLKEIEQYYIDIINRNKEMLLKLNADN